MSEIWVLLLLVLIAVLPLIIVLFCFRAVKIKMTLSWFIAAMAAGMISLFAAALVQNLLPRSGVSSLGPLLFGVFIRIALVEESSRLLTLFFLFKTGKRHISDDAAFAGALGLVAGLGFAAVESAAYGSADLNITLLRAFTAAPLHGACGIRAAAAIFTASRAPAKSLFLFISAIFIHGAYNLFLVSPAFPSILAALVAALALFASLPLLKTGQKTGIDISSSP